MNEKTARYSRAKEAPSAASSTRATVMSAHTPDRPAAIPSVRLPGRTGGTGSGDVAEASAPGTAAAEGAAGAGIAADAGIAVGDAAAGGAATGGYGVEWRGGDFGGERG
jgi:hypothetical protein